MFKQIPRTLNRQRQEDRSEDHFFAMKQRKIATHPENLGLTAFQEQEDNFFATKQRKIAAHLGNSGSMLIQRQEDEAQACAPYPHRTYGLTEALLNTHPQKIELSPSSVTPDTHYPNLMNGDAIQRQSKKINKTGLPDRLKSGIETLSGLSMDDVKVHYNSSKPGQLQALAYTQGTDIHVAPGQEKYLPHEAWHSVQQKEGRVKPTMQVKGVSINADTDLEREADIMGAKATQLKVTDPGEIIQPSRIVYNSNTTPVTQRQVRWEEGPRQKVKHLVGPILRFTDFGITPVNVNGTEIPPGNAAALLAGPAIAIEHKENGSVEVSIALEPINTISYRMELPIDPPWSEQTTVAHANAALGMLSTFSISEDIAPDRDAQITVEAKGLPNDVAFAALVEKHEDVHVDDLIKNITEILIPWDTNIVELMHDQRTFVGESEEEAIAKLYEAIGGSAEDVGQRFNDSLRESGLAFHHTEAGSSPTIDHTTFSGDTLRVYWKHPMG